MRRLVGLFAAIALLLAVAAPVAAQGPERSWTEETELSFGPEYCGFPAQLVDTFSANKALVFPPDGEGKSRILLAGVIKSTPDQSGYRGSHGRRPGGKITVLIGAMAALTSGAAATIFLWYSPPRPR